MSHVSGPCFLTELSSDVATCPSALELASVRMLPRVSLEAMLLLLYVVASVKILRSHSLRLEVAVVQ
jgi:hypothetical protein